VTTERSGRPRPTEVLRAATATIERVLAENQGAALVERLRETLPSVQSALTSHARGDDSPSGLHDTVIKADPRLKQAADRLLEEHRELAARMSGLGSQLATQAASVAEAGSELTPPQVRAAADDLVKRLHRHLERSSNLLYEALERDIGAGD
jgi:hypothetical protein